MGAEHPITLVSQGKLAEAEPLLLEAMEATRRTFQSDYATLHGLKQTALPSQIGHGWKHPSVRDTPTPKRSSSDDVFKVGLL